MKSKPPYTKPNVACQPTYLHTADMDENVFVRENRQGIIIPD